MTGRERRRGGQFARGNQLSPMTHGGYSSRRLVPAARNIRRRTLRRLGLRAGQLTAFEYASLDSFARCSAKVESMDAWVATNRWLDDKGNAPSFADTYFRALRLRDDALGRLEESLRERTSDERALDRYLHSAYGDAEDAEPVERNAK